MSHFNQEVPFGGSPRTSARGKLPSRTKATRIIIGNAAFTKSSLEHFVVKAVRLKRIVLFEGRVLFLGGGGRRLQEEQER